MDQKGLIKFLSFWIANAIVLLFVSAVFGNNVVLGNDKLSSSMAAVLSAFVLTSLGHFVPNLVEKLDFKIKNEYAWQGVYLVGNVIIIWIVKRFAQLTGFGVANNFYVIIIAAIVTLVHWAIFKGLGSVYKK